MNLPLYKDNDVPKEPPADRNAGLWFERFFSAYTNDFKEVDKDTKKTWVDNLKKSSVGNNYSLQEHASRQFKMIDDLGGQSCTFECTWHFITGMGNPHPVENGFTWHPTLGVPYLPGSAVKGLVRSWIEQWDEDKGKEHQDKLIRWFGSDHKDPKQRTEKKDHTGELIFFDAIPVKQPSLTVDIMTPHMGKWYEQGGEIKNVANEPEAVPADWHDPVPVPYLVTDKATFLFGVALRSSKKSIDKPIDLGKIMETLDNALNWLGAGAKTAVGYGQMQKEKNQQSILDLRKIIKERQEKKKAEKKSEEEIQDLSSLAKEFYEQCRNENWYEDKDSFCRSKLGAEWLDKLEQEYDNYIVAQLYELMSKHFNGIMDNPDKTKGKKRKHVFNDSQRNIANRLLKLKAENSKEQQ